jgi:hypothetical protein
MCYMRLIVKLMPGVHADVDLSATIAGYDLDVHVWAESDKAD